MGCINKILFTAIFTISNLTGIIPITSKASSYPKEFGRHQGPPTDWEPGLKEAANQALIRERIGGINLRDGLLKAPIIGKQNNASPFGDIAILARGQLVSTPNGFEFVQDRYQNDYHDRPCKNKQCHVYNGAQKVLALWTVKRIRHRDSDYGHRYELEYTISPVKDGFISKREGFDYAVPGHVFIVRLSSKGIERNSFKVYNRDQYVKGGNYPTFVNTNQQNGYQQPPHHYLPYDAQPSPLTPVITTHPTLEYNQKKEFELYHNLLNSLAHKTTTKQYAPTKDTYHRFGPPTKGTTPIIYEKPKSTQPTFFTTHPSYPVNFITNHIKPASTVQPFIATVFVPDYGITKETTPYTTPQHETTRYAITEAHTHSEQTTQPIYFSTKITIPTHQTTKQTTPNSNTFATSLFTPTKETISKITTPSYFTSIKTSHATYPPTNGELFSTQNSGFKTTSHYSPTKQTTSYFAPSRENYPHPTKAEQFTTQNTGNAIDSHFSTVHETSLKQTTPSYLIPIETSHGTQQQTVLSQHPTSSYFTTPTSPEYLTQIKTSQQPYTYLTSKQTTPTFFTLQSNPSEETNTQTTGHDFTTQPLQSTLINRVPQTNSPIPTFYIDPNHPGYPKTTPTTPFADDDAQFTKHPFIPSPTFVQYSDPDLTTNEVTVPITNPTKNPQTTTSKQTESTLTLPTNPDRYFPQSTPHEIHLPTKPHKPNTPFIKPTIHDDFIPYKPNDDDELELFPEDKNKPPPTTTTTSAPKPTEGFLLHDDDYVPIKKQHTNETELFEKQATTSKPAVQTQITNSKDINEVFTTNTTKHPVLPSNIFEDLFEARRAKSYIESAETTTAGLKIIYADFYTAAPKETTSKEIDDVPKNTIPSTSQSYSTSVTFEVNKNKRTQKALNEIVTTSTEMSPSKQLDELALSVVNHARSIDYLENKKVKKVKRRRKGYVRKVIKKVN